MKTLKQTPAPWQYDAQRHEIYGANGKGELIATSVYGANGKGELIATSVYGADAALIAAAPDLLLALIDAMYQDDHKHLTPDEHWYHKAKRAIDKAEGDL